MRDMYRISDFNLSLSGLLCSNNNREIKRARFWDADGNRKWIVFPFNLSSHNHIYIAKYLFSIRDDWYKNLGDTTVLACERGRISGGRFSPPEIRLRSQAFVFTITFDTRLKTALTTRPVVFQSWNLMNVLFNCGAISGHSRWCSQDSWCRGQMSDLGCCALQRWMG